MMQDIQQLRMNRLYLAGTVVAQNEVDFFQCIGLILPIGPIGCLKMFVGMSIVKCKRPYGAGFMGYSGKKANRFGKAHAVKNPNFKK